MIASLLSFIPPIGRWSDVFSSTNRTDERVTSVAMDTLGHTYDAFSLQVIPHQNIVPLSGEPCVYTETLFFLNKGAEGRAHLALYHRPESVVMHAFLTTIYRVQQDAFDPTKSISSEFTQYLSYLARRHEVKFVRLQFEAANPKFLQRMEKIAPMIGDQPIHPEFRRHLSLQDKRAILPTFAIQGDLFITEPRDENYSGVTRLIDQNFLTFFIHEKGHEGVITIKTSLDNEVLRAAIQDVKPARNETQLPLEDVISSLKEFGISLGAKKIVLEFDEQLIFFLPLSSANPLVLELAAQF